MLLDLSVRAVNTPLHLVEVPILLLISYDDKLLEVSNELTSFAAETDYGVLATFNVLELTQPLRPH
jgi:hypothetical protein